MRNIFYVHSKYDMPFINLSKNRLHIKGWAH